MSSQNNMAKESSSLQNHCNIPNFQFGMLYIVIHAYHILFAFRLAILENPKQLKDPLRELGISRFSNLIIIKY